VSVRRVRRHVEVENDILSIARWIARDSPAAAERFLWAAEETILGLSYMPERGSLKGWRGQR
jgi:plasmid stabilization system protein ParE